MNVERNWTVISLKTELAIRKTWRRWVIKYQSHSHAKWWQCSHQRCKNSYKNVYKVCFRLLHYFINLLSLLRKLKLESIMYFRIPIQRKDIKGPAAKLIMNTYVCFQLKSMFKLVRTICYASSPKTTFSTVLIVSNKTASSIFPPTENQLQVLQ